MAREHRPKPPPLDDAQQDAEDDGAQGKAALAELEAKHAESGSSKSPTAASALETQSDGELAARAAAGPPQPPVPKVPALGKVRASIRDSKEGFIARPDPACPIGEDVPVVRFNWCGLVGGRRVDVASGTPVECLPDALVDRIGRTPNAIIAPRGPKPPPNPHAP